MYKEEYSKVTFIMPVLNEAKTLRQCLDALLALDYPAEKIEILIALGNSTDDTRAIAEEYARKHQTIKLFENPTGNTAIGRNICIEHATGELLMNYSGHVIAEQNLLFVLVTKLLELPDEIAAVGCSNVSPDEQNLIGKATGVAFAGFMGGRNIFPQNEVFDDERYVDHVSFACYRRNVVEQVGNFDPAFWCGQDAELDIRIYKAGYKILYTPDTKVYHFKRSTTRGLFRQMYRYGLARARMVRKHPDTFRVVYTLGSAFVLGIITISALTALTVIPLWFGGAIASLYVFLAVISSFQVTKTPLLILTSIPLYFIIHVAYGLGFLRGLSPARASKCKIFKG
ncbi:MAG: glycosyltransferase [Methanomicrobia archaeon]|nr:glycosyltransferase [Methanomicrobia archaeon]